MVVEEPLFPRYIFIFLDEKFGNWVALKSTRGISHLVCFRAMPAVVPDEVVEGLKTQANEHSVIDRTKNWSAKYSAGDQVEIRGGNFHGIRAVVEKQTAEERVILLLNLLGRPQSLAFPIEAVFKI